MIKSELAKEIYPANEGNFTYGRSGRNIEAITIHHMAGRLTAQQCGGIFQQEGRQASSHYGIGYDGEIACYVGEENTAWTNSNWDSNCKSVTIETADENTDWYVNDITLNSLIKLVADIAKRNNLGDLVPGQNLTWHSMFANTTCPGDYLRSKMQYIADEANKINNPMPTPEPQPAPTPVVEFKVGDIVVPTELVDYDGTPLVQYDDNYVITELVGDRAVLSANRDGELIIWAALNTNNIKKI